jgi:hypothetical protein
VTTTQAVEAVEAYINEVRERLADVPDEERVDLLDDVAAHVREIAEEFGADQIRDRLGSPEEFTDELRASAGYAPPAEHAAGLSPSLWSRMRSWLDKHVRTAANRALWRNLEPGWFVLRGVMAGFALSRLTRSGAFAVVVMIAGAVASYRLGERRPSPQRVLARRARIAAELLLVVVALGLFNDSRHDRYVYVDGGPSGYGGDPCLRDSAGRAIGNLYAFDPSGAAIPRFFLTDQAGRPIDNLCPQEAPDVTGEPAETTYARDTNGNPVYGVFPRQQQHLQRDATTGEITKSPVSPPAVVFPQLSPTVSESTTTTEAPAPQP